MKSQNSGLYRGSLYLLLSLPRFLALSYDVFRPDELWLVFVVVYFGLFKSITWSTIITSVRVVGVASTAGLKDIAKGAVRVRLNGRVYYILGLSVVTMSLAMEVMVTLAGPTRIWSGRCRYLGQRSMRSVRMCRFRALVSRVVFHDIVAVL